MRYKIVPEPRDIAFLETAQGALPLVPGTVEDCCTRLVDRTNVPSRDVAREYLTFLQALELVAETPRGFKRRRVAVEPATLADAFERRVYGAKEVLAAVDTDGPLTVETAFDHVKPIVPRWERDRHTDWEAEWRERTRRLLEWATRFDRIERRDGRYHAIDAD